VIGVSIIEPSGFAITQELKDTVVFADQMMYMGFQYSTKSGISFAPQTILHLRHK
jgi:hypothetical protein